MLAWNAIDHLDGIARPILGRLKTIDTKNPYPEGSPKHGRMRTNLKNLKKKTLADLRNAR